MVPRHRNNGFIVSVILVVFQITTVSCIDMCKNETATGNSVFFSRTENGITNCHCTLSLKSAGSAKITFNTKTVPGCGLLLAVMYKTDTSYYSCTSNNTIFHTIYNDEKIELRLEPGTGVTDAFEFGFKIESQPNGSTFTISCYSLPNPPTTLRSTRTILQTDTSPRSTTSTEPTEESLQTTTVLQSKSPIMYTISQTPTENYSLYLVPGIIGGMIGTTVVIVVFVIITLCILKIRKYKSKSTSPTQVSDPDYLEIVP